MCHAVRIFLFCSDFVSHYRLAMDALDDEGSIVNEFSLHAVLHRPARPPADGARQVPSALTDGVDGRAVRLDGSHSFIDIDTSALKMECFGDLNKCHMGKYF